VPAALEGLAAAGRRDRFLFDSGTRGGYVVAGGVSDEVESAGARRFDDVRGWTEAVRSRIAWIGDERSPTAPTFFGGFGFEPESRGSEDWKAFPAARFFLPEWILERRDAATGYVLLARVEPGTSPAAVEAELAERARTLASVGRGGVGAQGHLDEREERAFEQGACGPEFRVRADRPHAVFRGQVDAALEAIRAGRIDKVVLARSLRVDHDGRFDVLAFLSSLRAVYPTCVVLAMGRGNDTFLAATPESLVRVEGDLVETAALAGSAPRGLRAEEDRALAEGLMSSEKERREHAFVVEAIRATLDSCCTSLDAPETPALRQLAGIQHLETPFRGRLGRNPETGKRADVLTLVEALHPTPAVGGVPRAAAQDWLRRHEALDRGWYASPVGWLDVEGGGDFRVALRSGLVRNEVEVQEQARHGRALLFAGAGLVAGSEAEQELVETRIKLRALLAPLTEI
jgi:isochorismate synthase